MSEDQDKESAVSFLPFGKENACSARSALIEASLRLGFSACRVAPAVPTPFGDRYRAWLARGCGASMDWLERQLEKRLNPDLVLPNARAIVMLAFDYAPRDARATCGRFARYAQGADYHTLLEEKLADLDETLQMYGGQQRCYVDAGPVNERDYAVLSGIGWRGKNGQILRPAKGSLFFLATILTTLPLLPDAPVRSRCGACRRCEEKCPGGALKDGLCDSRRCLSYWNIEHKGSIPEEWRIRMGDRLYGCDACLEACPWNTLAREAADTRLLMSKEIAEMPLQEFLALNDEGFLALFRHSPVRRIKRERFLRNVCCVLGNVGGEEDIPALRRALQDTPLIAEHAAWALTRIDERKQKSLDLGETDGEKSCK